VFSNVDALLKRVQPKTQLRAPTVPPNMARESTVGRGAPQMMGGSMKGPGMYPPPNGMQGQANNAYPNPNLDRTGSQRGGIVGGGAPQQPPFDPRAASMSGRNAAMGGGGGGGGGGQPVRARACVRACVRVVIVLDD
jgi:hypothetical protein